MGAYFRPIVQSEPVWPNTALPLGRSGLWFDRAMCLERGRPAKVVPISEVPHDLLDRFAHRPTGLAGLNATGPAIMGVLNLTPDSFSDGGRFNAPQAALARAREMLEAGADILDLGGESTRPGAQTVETGAEIARTVPVIETIRAAGLQAPISIDTRKAEVARAAIEAGADIINDVSALSYDAGMAGLAAKLAVPVCLMHAQGGPETMQDAPSYDDVLLDVYDALAAQIETACAAGISHGRLVIDPGIGFGKTYAHNMALLRGLSLFHGLGCPIVLGVSRKGFIGTITGTDMADQRGPGSMALGMAALAQGVQVLRVHDIAMHRQMVAVWQALISPFGSDRDKSRQI